MSVKTMMSHPVLPITMPPIPFTGNGNGNGKGTDAVLTMRQRAFIAKHLGIIVHGYLAKFHSKPNKL